MNQTGYLTTFFAVLTGINTVLIVFLNFKKVYNFLIKPKFTVRSFAFAYQEYFDFHIEVSNNKRWRFRPRATACEAHITIRDSLTAGDVLSDRPLVWEEYESRRLTIPSGSQRVLRLISISNDETRKIIVRGKDINGQRQGSLIPRGAYDIVIEVACEEETTRETLQKVRLPEDVVAKAGMPLHRT